MNRPSVWICAFGMAIWAVLPNVGRAQIASGGDTVLFRSDAAGVRVEPQYQVPPLMLGAVQATVAMTARVVADSNVFRVAENAVDDSFVEFLPSIRLLAGLGPHSAALSAQASARRYAKLTTDNRTNLSVLANGQVALGSASSATWRIGYARERETRGAGGLNVIAARPGEFRSLQSSVAATTQFGKLSVAASLGVVQTRYAPLRLANGAALGQSFRDVRTVRVAPRASYAFGSSASFFLAGAASRTRPLDRAVAMPRDASGFAVLGGLRSETDGLLIGELGIGWRAQNYRDARFRDFSGLTYDATIDWYPTRLVSVRVQAGQDIVNSGLPTVAGIVRRSLVARAYYDPLRKLRFVLTVDRDVDAFRELGFSTRTSVATLTGRYQLGRHVDISSFGRIESRASPSNALVPGYESVAFGVAVTGVL